MNDKIKAKIKQAIDKQSNGKSEKHLNYKCPLRSWDIFCIMKEELKQKNCKSLPK
jgi:hypothetical protein